MQQKIAIIFGPTSSGKTALSLSIAQFLRKQHTILTEVISADSCQVYKGMTIGTNKVSTAEQQLVPHHNIDVETPDNHYTADRFLQTVTSEVPAILNRNNVPLIVGGSMSLITNLVDKKDCYFLILSPSFSHPELERRIELTVQGMFKKGLYAEVRQLVRQYGDSSSQLNKIIGYWEFLEYAQVHGKNVHHLNEADLAAIKSQITKAHKAYAAHQIALLNTMEVRRVLNPAEAAKLILKHYSIESDRS